MIKKVKKVNSKNSQINTGILVLENKRVFKGIGIGYQGEATGEVCFNTSITGYQEIISDPSYAGSPGPLDKKIPFGLSARIFLADVLQETTVTLQLKSEKYLKIFFLIP